MNINCSVVHRCFHSFSVLYKKSHYDALGLTPKATQGEIKTAYYKLSMLYHPDKNKGSEKANEKFKDITAAYEVLGNFNSRRMYDRGLSGVNISNVEPRGRGAEDIVKGFGTKGSRIQTSRGAFTGRTPIYDFDEWSRIHYGQIVERRAQAKNMSEKQRRNEAKHKDHAVFSILFALMVMLIFSYSYTSNLDVPQRKDSSK